MSDLTAQTPLLLTTPYRKPIVSPRSLRRFLGLTFGFSAIGLWLAPGASDMADVLLLKTGLTAILSFCAIVALLPRR